MSSKQTRISNWINVGGYTKKQNNNQGKPHGNPQGNPYGNQHGNQQGNAQGNQHGNPVQNGGKKNKVHYMTADIKGYWSNPDIYKKYSAKTGVQVRKKIEDYIRTQSDENTYVSYQKGAGAGINIYYVYKEHSDAAYSQMFYCFIKLANPDLDPILEPMCNKSENWNKSTQGTQGSYNDYSFLNKLVWLDNTVSIHVFKEMYVKMTSKSISPFKENSDNEDSYGSLMACYKIADNVREERLDAMLTSVTSNIIETKIRGVFNKSVGNTDDFITEVRYSYCLYQDLFYNMIIEVFTRFIDLPRANMMFVSLTTMMNTLFHTFDTEFLDTKNTTSFSTVIKEYSNKINYVTNLKKQSVIAKRQREWNTVYELAEQIKSVSIKWEPVLADYYFSKFGKDKYPTMDQSLSSLAKCIYTKVEMLCDDFVEYNKHADPSDERYKIESFEVITRLSWSLESLISALGEIYHIGYLQKDVLQYINTMLIGTKCFKHIPDNIKIKIAIRACTHGGITDKDTISNIVKLGNTLKDKATQFLVNDFKDSINKKRDSDKQVEVDDCKEDDLVKQFYTLSLKNAVNQGFNDWIEDLVHDINERTTVIKYWKSGSAIISVSYQHIADRLITDLMFTVNGNNKDEQDHLIATLTNKLLVDKLSKKVLNISFKKFENSEELEDLKIDYPWLSSNIEIVSKLM
jgi:hypothetical protein